MGNVKFYLIVFIGFGFFVVALFNFWGASLRWHFLLSLIAAYHLAIIGKSIRDIIAYRFKWSVFNNAHVGLKKYLLDLYEKEFEEENKQKDYPDALDGWHQADRIYLMAPLALVTYWGNYFIFQLQWYWLILIYGVIAFGFIYQEFNFLYHSFFMKVEYRD